MKIRKPPFDLNAAMSLNTEFNYLWSGEKASSLLGIGYSFYFEYLEHFIYEVSKFSKEMIHDQGLKSAEKIFLTQELHHANAHKKLNDFIYNKKQYIESYHPRVYDFFYGHYKTHLEPILSGIRASDPHDPHMKMALKEIAHFESTSCVSGFAFFQYFFDNGRIHHLEQNSANLAILYLLAYHFTEEMEHSGVAHDVYEYIYHTKVWDKQTLADEVQHDNFKDMESLKAALYAAKLLNIELTLQDLQYCDYYRLTRATEIKYITENFHPNNPEISEIRHYYINKWDNEWEPQLQKIITANSRLASSSSYAGAAKVF